MLNSVTSGLSHSLARVTNITPNDRSVSQPSKVDDILRRTPAASAPLAADEAGAPKVRAAVPELATPAGFTPTRVARMVCWTECHSHRPEFLADQLRLDRIEVGLSSGAWRGAAACTAATHAGPHQKNR